MPRRSRVAAEPETKPRPPQRRPSPDREPVGAAPAPRGLGGDAEVKQIMKTLQEAAAAGPDRKLTASELERLHELGRRGREKLRELVLKIDNDPQVPEIKAHLEELKELLFPSQAIKEQIREGQQLLQDIADRRRQCLALLDSLVEADLQLDEQYFRANRRVRRRK
jgi:hypothetical protein